MSRAARRCEPRRRLSRLALGLAALAFASACSNERGASPAESTAQSVVPMPRQRSEAKLAYSHELTLGLPPERLADHFNAARERCLNDEALRCVLVQSSIGEAPRPSGRPQAQMRVRLPHESVPAFITFVTTPLPGETAADVVLREQATQADDLGRVIADGSRRLAQLNDYRDRLTVLAGKAESRVEDLVKIAQELAQVQAQIEEAEATQRGLDQRVETEMVSLKFRSDVARAGAFAPIQEAWGQSSRILGDSAGSALRFGIAAIPWLPIALVGLFIVRAVWRLRRRGRPGRLEPGGERRL